MNKFRQEYEQKKISLDEALSLIKSNDFVYTSFNALEPVEFLRNLHTIKDRVENVLVRQAGFWNDYEFASNPEMAGHFKAVSSFYDAYSRAAHEYKLTSYMPLHLHSSASRVLSKKKPTVFYGLATPMDDHGYVRFSLDLINEMDAVYEADLVIIQTNSNLPNVYGENAVHISDIDHIVEMDEPAITISQGAEPSELDMTIGKYVASLVPDGATIQLGIGNIPNAVGKFLNEKNDLGVHTEMITSIISDLAESRVITGKYKTLHPRLIIGNFALGSEQLYEYLTDNPEVMIMPGSYVNDPRVIAKNDNMISINTCLQVDLTGQICSESIGHKQFSGTGGANDFAVGANHSKGGKSIMAVKSTAKNGTISTIQPILSPGAVVSVGRNDIDYVVTEYGIARMKGCSIEERVENLINIAHPDFVDELQEGVKNYQIW